MLNKNGFSNSLGRNIKRGDIVFEECTFKNMNDACLVVGNETSSETNGLDHTKNVWVTKK